MVTLKQIALEVGVSPVTVSNVLNGKNRNVRREAAVRAEQIRKVAERLGYRPDGAARAMRSRQSNLVGVLGQSHPLMIDTILGINEGLDHAGYLTVLVNFRNTVNKSADESLGGRFLRERYADGAIIVNISDFNYGRIEKFLPEPRIMVETNVWLPDKCIRRDEVGAGYLAAEGAFQAGFRRILYVTRGSNNELFCFEDRIKGAAQFASENGMRFETMAFPVMPHPVIDIPKSKVGRDTAVIVSDAYLVLPTEHALANRGLASSVHYGLVCCDDSPEFSTTWHDLAHVSFNRFDMGYQAARMLVQLLKAPGMPCPSQMVQGRFVPGRTLRRL